MCLTHVWIHYNNSRAKLRRTVSSSQAACAVCCQEKKWREMERDNERQSIGIDKKPAGSRAWCGRRLSAWGNLLPGCSECATSERHCCRAWEIDHEGGELKGHDSPERGPHNAVKHARAWLVKKLLYKCHTQRQRHLDEDGRAWVDCAQSPSACPFYMHISCARQCCRHASAVACLGVERLLVTELAGVHWRYQGSCWWGDQ